MICGPRHATPNWGSRIHQQGGPFLVAQGAFLTAVAPDSSPGPPVTAVCRPDGDGAGPARVRVLRSPPSGERGRRRSGRLEANRGGRIGGPVGPGARRRGGLGYLPDRSLALTPGRLRPGSPVQARAPVSLQGHSDRQEKRPHVRGHPTGDRGAEYSERSVTMTKPKWAPGPIV